MGVDGFIQHLRHGLLTDAQEMAQDFVSKGVGRGGDEVG
jgi:hypothetical protein